MYSIPTTLYTALIFHESAVYGKISWFYFRKVDMIASGNSYKTLKLHDVNFTNVSKL